MSDLQLQYVSDEKGKTTSVIVPIELWRELISENETAYLLQSDTMRERLLAAMTRETGIPYEVAREELGI